MSVLLPNDPATAKAAAVRITASRLCLKMAGEFYKEDERGEAFDFCVVYLLKEMEKQHILRLEGLIGVYGRIQMRRGSRCGEDPDAEEAMLYTCRSLLLTMSRQTRKSMSLSTMDHHVS